MGEQKRRGRHWRLRTSNEGCVYCGGPADTVEHMPPISLFNGRQRPSGLEFLCCDACNSATRNCDQTAALLSRLFPDPPPEYRKEIGRLMRGVGNNVPGLLAEMADGKVGRAGRKLAAKRLNLPLESAHLLRIDGPILSRQLTLFAAKMGFALYREIAGEPVPFEGGVLPVYYSNAQVFRGEMPTELLDMLPGPKTLINGKRDVSDQFSYSSVSTEDGQATFIFAGFRQSFATGAIVVRKRDYFEVPAGALLFVRGGLRTPPLATS